MNLNQHYTFLMDPSNGAVILDDLGSFLLEKLQRSVGTGKTYRLYRSKFIKHENLWLSSEFFLLCNINHCTLINNFCSTATPTAFLITIVTSCRKSLSGNPVGNTVDTDEGDVP